jgi:hypothetical protein
MRAFARTFVPLLGLFLAGSAAAVQVHSDGVDLDASGTSSAALEAADSRDYPGVLIPILFPVTWDASRTEVLSVDAADYDRAAVLKLDVGETDRRAGLQGVTTTLP